MEAFRKKKKHRWSRPTNWQQVKYSHWQDNPEKQVGFLFLHWSGTGDRNGTAIHVKSHTEIFYNNKIGDLSFPNIEWRLMLFNHLTCLKKNKYKTKQKDARTEWVQVGKQVGCTERPLPGGFLPRMPSSGSRVTFPWVQTRGLCSTSAINKGFFVGTPVLHLWNTCNPEAWRKPVLGGGFCFESLPCTRHVTSTAVACPEI